MARGLHHGGGAGAEILTTVQDMRWALLVEEPYSYDELLEDKRGKITELTVERGSKVPTSLWRNEGRICHFPLITTLYERAGMPKEPRDYMVDYDMTFDIMRVKGSQGNIKKKRKVKSNRDSSNDQRVSSSGAGPSRPSGPLKLIEADMADMREILGGLSRRSQEVGALGRLGGGEKEEALVGQATGSDVKGDEKSLMDPSSPLEAPKGNPRGFPVVLLPAQARKKGFWWLKHR
ncbi:hypothetical protein HAX54_004361 [Datura stramonium]|uniref:Uncharacterized protein n=1 Tax=Datura stramonium TaxID=4076 RepID=A0ABS8T6T0_DATST|nr:hypothetical protein [Datura stramonium]